MAQLGASCGSPSSFVHWFTATTAGDAALDGARAGALMLRGQFAFAASQFGFRSDSEFVAISLDVFGFKKHESNVNMKLESAGVFVCVSHFMSCATTHPHREAEVAKRKWGHGRVLGVLGLLLLL